MTDFSAIVGARLREYRVWHEATQDYVAGQMQTAGFSWTRDTVGRVEGGKRPLTLDEFCVLAAVIGVDPADLWPEAS